MGTDNKDALPRVDRIVCPGCGRVAGTYVLKAHEKYCIYCDALLTLGHADPRRAKPSPNRKAPPL